MTVIYEFWQDISATVRLQVGSIINLATHPMPPRPMTLYKSWPGKDMPD